VAASAVDYDDVVRRLFDDNQRRLRCARLAITAQTTRTSSAASLNVDSTRDNAASTLAAAYAT
jgi:hypothetical protein